MRPSYLFIYRTHAQFKYKMTEKTNNGNPYSVEQFNKTYLYKSCDTLKN